MVMENEEVSFADTVFGFWDEFQVQSENSSNSSSFDEDYNDEEESFCSDEKNKAFWEEQDQLLQGTLCRTSSSETKVRHATKEALREFNMSERACICWRPEAAAAKTKTCRDCLQRELRDRLLKLGFNCFICKSKWTSSPGITSGEHTYLEVVDKSNTKRGEVKVVIELSLRGEFEMARANEEYNQLLRKLPEVFIGKSERLKVLVKIMCSAAKKCMKDKKMHLAPWRKQKYMLAKWVGTYDRSIMEPLPRVYNAKPQKPKTSMLTFDLLENISGLHCNNAVEVV
ncbi:hypothetical protein TanjilG_11701 [Lupinus angustifolius]|uniref:Uncharacterized protein n=1 Tax=Lupinus angustifolius TaxID=3871 RepID=A0A1J7GZV1_LUPAN|nr:PREDICTED: uncharacterized protein LOC109353699 [Lupinus angustifolius]OIW06014.1 hypothetical protein TanjilG_11701 [Lupinus angustifolius]